jgi:hypothetical protein
MALRVVLERDAADAADVDAEQVDPAPGVRPRTDWSKTIRTGTATPSAGASAERRSAKSVKTVFSGACGARAVSGGASKAMPPASTEASVCVLTLRPLAFRVEVDAARVPEAAVQGDELLVRRLDKDLHRQLVALGVERVADDPADRRAAWNTGEPTSSEPRSSERSTKIEPGSPRSTKGAASRPMNSLRDLVETPASVPM